METYLGMLDVLEQWPLRHGVSELYADTVKLMIVFVVIGLLAILADFVTKRIILVIVYRIAKKTETVFDDILVEKKVFHRLAHLAPAIVVYYTVILPLAEYPKILRLVQNVSQVYMLVVGLIGLKINYIPRSGYLFVEKPTNASSKPHRGGLLSN